MTEIINSIDVDNIVDSFIKRKYQSFVILHRHWFKNSNTISIQSLMEEVKEDLKTGCISFINKKYDMQELDSYLLYIVNAFCKKQSIPKISKRKEYICPGCLFIGKENILFYNKYFACDSCNFESQKNTDPKWIEFYSVFKKHNKSGFKCRDCKRFIPQPFNIPETISCPYIDCGFAGELSLLKKMHHPTSQTSVEILTVDASKEDGLSFKDLILSNDNPLKKIEERENFDAKLLSIRNTITHQLGSLPYNSSGFTIKHKELVYKAFLNYLDKEPEMLVEYLVDNSRSGGFQHKIFQEYISLLEDSLPIIISKNKKNHKISSLLDENLCLFDGLSTFSAIINDKLEIKNNTQEIYIGGRKSSYVQKFYIGKLLNIVDEYGNPILNKVISYNFNKIILKEVSPNTTVTVTHLRVPPHYQMGGMVYVNRIRKKIVKQAAIYLEKWN